MAKLSLKFDFAQVGLGSPNRMGIERANATATRHAAHVDFASGIASRRGATYN